MIEQYKNFWISGTAKLVHPYSYEMYVAGEVYEQGRSTSIVELTRFELPSFTVADKHLAEFFGLELARMVVDECLAPAGPCALDAVARLFVTS
jgi:putative membrane protein